MTSGIPVKGGFLLNLISRAVTTTVRAERERHYRRGDGSRCWRRCEWLMMGGRLTNGRTLYGPTSNHQVTNLEHSGQTRVQGPTLRPIDGASKRSRNSAIQSLIVQSDSIDPDCPLPLLFSDSIYRKCAAL